uniref:Rhodanese domain-containing protein n=1 Tax=Mesocestoides corti TaxID=53468 RepID=A0A5K3F680_MESCO
MSTIFLDQFSARASQLTNFKGMFFRNRGMQLCARMVRSSIRCRMVVEPRRLLRSAQSVRSMLGYTSACRHLATRSNSIWITKKELSSLLNSSDILIIDVREPNEILETGIIPGAFNVPFSKIKESLSSNSTLFRERFGFNREDLISKRFVFVCRSGVQSARSVEIAKELGFHNVQSLDGGYEGWISQNS